MSDLIERQAAVGKLKRMATQAYIDKLNGRAETVINCCIDVIERQIPSAQPVKRTEERTETHACDCISRQAVYNVLDKIPVRGFKKDGETIHGLISLSQVNSAIINLPSAQPDIEKICARIKAEAIKRNVEYMKHGDRYMLGFVDGMRLARRIVDGTIDDPVYFTLSGE